MSDDPMDISYSQEEDAAAMPPPMPPPPMPPPPMPPPAARLREYHTEEEAFEEKGLKYSDTVLLARFEQFKRDDFNVHELLRYHLFSFPDNVARLLNNDEVCKYYDEGTQRAKPVIIRSPADLSLVNIRFASVYVSIKPQGGRQHALIEAYLVNTAPVNRFYVINLLKLPSEELNVYTSDGGILSILLFKIVRELKVLGYKLNGTDVEKPTKPLKLLISFDIYYNRARDRAGLFHRDSGEGPGNDLIDVSLEFFAPPQGGIYFLGPEVVLLGIGNQTPDMFIGDRYDVKTIIDYRRANPQQDELPSHKSFRLLCKDGTTILFNDKLLIHATPITDPVVLDEGAEPVNEFAADEQRLEVEYPMHPIVHNTRTMIRSFLRTHFAPFQGFNPTNSNSVRIPGYRLLALIAGIPGINYDASTVTEEDLYGGEKLNIEANPLLETKLQNTLPNKTPSSEGELLDFKIVGNQSKPPIEINLNVPFEEVTGENNIKNNELQLVSFISSLINKKGGKNRRYKKRYNNKTKKAIKTKKVRKLKRSTKTKKVKRVKKLYKYSKKNYKY